MSAWAPHPLLLPRTSAALLHAGEQCQIQRAPEFTGMALEFTGMTPMIWVQLTHGRVCTNATWAHRATQPAVAQSHPALQVLGAAALPQTWMPQPWPQGGAGNGKAGISVSLVGLISNRKFFPISPRWIQNHVFFNSMPSSAFCFH